LVVSLATLGVLAVAALKENVFAPWRQTRLQYAHILQQKATDERGRALADQFRVEIAQNVVPELNETVDRCITCHAGIDDPRMLDQENPYKAHPGDFLLNHPPEKFGCTICHRGQGRALVFDEVKGEGHHWDFPLLPKNLTQASCGACHAPDEVAQNGGEAYALGKELFESRGCVGCHKLNGRGGSVGPALDAVGRKLTGQLPMAHVDGPRTLPQWLKEHFDDPQKIVADSQMKPPQLTPEENEALTIYMLSLQGLDLPDSYISPRKHLETYQIAFPAERSGEELFKQYCAVCHDSGTFSRYDDFYKKFFPAVRGPSLALLASPEYIEQNIRQGRPGTLMSAWSKDAGGLTDDEIARLRDYLLSGAAADGMPEKAVEIAKNTEYTASGDAQRGAPLYARLCSSCHGVEGEGKLAPALRNPTLQKTTTDGLLYATIAYGRRNTPMPAFLGPETGGLSESNIEDLVAFIRTFGLITPANVASAPVAPDTQAQLAKEVSQ